MEGSSDEPLVIAARLTGLQHAAEAGRTARDVQAAAEDGDLLSAEDFGSLSVDMVTTTLQAAVAAAGSSSLPQDDGDAVADALADIEAALDRGGNSNSGSRGEDELVGLTGASYQVALHDANEQQQQQESRQVDLPQAQPPAAVEGGGARGEVNAPSPGRMRSNLGNEDSFDESTATPNPFVRRKSQGQREAEEAIRLTQEVIVFPFQKSCDIDALII